MDPKQPRTIPIQGVKVQFPCKPYPSQLSMMAKIIKGIGSGQNCLLESPTGTGKSLALLCSALAWQNDFIEKANSGRLKDPCCCKCHVKASSPPDTKPELVSSEHLLDNSSKGSEVVPSLKTSPVCGSSQDKNDNHMDEDFKSPKTDFRTPAANISKKRKHTPISYEEDTDEQKKTSPSTSWTVEVTNTRVSPPGTENVKKGSSVDGQGCMKCDCGAESAEMGEVRPPTIYYCTRTHRQIKQITRELGKTAYKGTEMAILSSRDYSCINNEVLQMSNRNDGCKEMVDLHHCRFYEKSKKVKYEAIVDAGLDTAYDLEDFKDVCASMKCCPYFSSRELLSTARLVFCPYNYLIEPVIRDAMTIGIKDQVVIFDEAHNIEDFARAAASASFTDEQLQRSSEDLNMMINENVKPQNHGPLKNMVDKILHVVHENGDVMHPISFEESSKHWSGPELVVMLKRMGLSSDEVDNLKYHMSIISDENDQDEVRRRNTTGKLVKLSSATMMVLKNLFEVLRFINMEKMKYLYDYRLALVKKREWRSGPTNNRWMSKRNRGLNNPEQVFVYKLHFWCLNPAVAFSDLECVRCVVLTSGTLSPLASFESELGMSFPIQLEANHVISPNQVLVGTIGKGPKGGQLLASYQKSETFEFQDETGGTILQICKTIPHGVLCFVSSYKMLEKLRNRWQMTGLWSEIQNVKSIHCEPRKTDSEDFDTVIRDFYTDIRESESGMRNGALLFAVCRGKVSEGIDFSDNNARAVITIGIPFPNIKDTLVELKRKYNDRQCHQKKLLSGSEWYEIQAYRALNQALGRCIRHRHDWGAIILVDERFSKQSHKYIKGISKWLRTKVTHFENFSDMRGALRSFAEEMETNENLNETTSSPVFDPSINISPSFSKTPDISLGTSSCASPVLSATKKRGNYETYPSFTPTSSKQQGKRSSDGSTNASKPLRSKLSMPPQACSTPAQKWPQAHAVQTSHPTGSAAHTPDAVARAFSDLPAELMKALPPEMIPVWHRFLASIGGKPVFVSQKDDHGQDCFSPAISKDGKLFFIALQPPQTQAANTPVKAEAVNSSAEMPLATVVKSEPPSVISDTAPAVRSLLSKDSIDANRGADAGVDKEHVQSVEGNVSVKQESGEEGALPIKEVNMTAEKCKCPASEGKAVKRNTTVGKSKKKRKGVLYESDEDVQNDDIDINGNDKDKAQGMGGDHVHLVCKTEVEADASSVDKQDINANIDQSCDQATAGQREIKSVKTCEKYTPYLYRGTTSVKMSTGSGENAPGRKKLFKFVDIPHTPSGDKAKTGSVIENPVSDVGSVIKMEATGACDNERSTSPLLFDSESNDALQLKSEPKDDTPMDFKSALQITTEDMDTKDNVKKRPNTRMSRLARHTLNSSGIHETELDSAEEEPEIKRRRGRKRRGSSAKREATKKQNVDLQDEADGDKKDAVQCQQCGQSIPLLVTQSGGSSYQKDQSPSFMLKIGMKSNESYVFDKAQSSLLFTQLEAHLPDSDLYNCYWSADDACCVQYLVCKRCSENMTLPIGAQVLAVGDGPCRFKVGQIWLSCDAFLAA